MNPGANCVGMEPKLFQIGSGRMVFNDYLLKIQIMSGVSGSSSGSVQGTEYTFEATDAQIEMVEEAVDSCPTRAITMKRS